MGFSAVLLSFVWTNLASLKKKEREKKERKEGGKKPTALDKSL